MLFTRKTILIFSTTFLVVLGLLIEGGIHKNSKMALLEVSFLDVGQGDSILINFLHNYQILIDSGANGKKVLTELAKVMPFMDNKIEVIIITHPDRDHFAGFLDVIKKYDIGLILNNGQNTNDEVWQSLQQIIAQDNIPVQTVLEGSTMKINSTTKELKFSFFNPDKISVDKKAKNDNSVVVRMDYGENSFLFTGDAGFDAEADMIFDKENLNIDWLKIGHHGSKNSTSDFFLARTTPKWAVISVGENDYGHPTEEVLNKLRAIGSIILRTDKLGTIVIGCDKDCVVK
jgi:competence protein ComEC